MSLEYYRSKIEKARTRLEISRAVSKGIAVLVVTVTAGWASVPNDVVRQWAYECAREGFEQIMFWSVTIALLLAPTVAGAITYMILYGFWIDFRRDELRAAENSYLYARALLGG